MKAPSFPKIYALGKIEIRDIFKSDVEITEKVDGSQFVFGIDTEGELVFRSKGKEMFLDAHEKMFNKAVEYLQDNLMLIRDVLKPGTFVYAEYLQKPKHNVLSYERVPDNHLIVFGVKIDGNFVYDYVDVEATATALKLETVPLIYKGPVNTIDATKGIDFLKQLLTTTPSTLKGDYGIEGIVVKNYWQHTSIGDPTICCGKYVRESFKERHQKEWKTGGDTVQEFINSFRTEARWAKAVQHLKEKGELENDPRDIGKLMKEINLDIHAEETEDIKDFLFKHFVKQITRKAGAGFPEWYKEQLLQGAFTTEEFCKDGLEGIDA